MSEYTIYIDEAGDLGRNRGTRWFVLSAVIVNKKDEPQIRATINRIRARLNVREIHFRNIKGFEKSAFVVKELNKENFVYTNVIVDTTKLNSQPAVSSLIVYNYICRMLLERVSWYLRDNHITADVVLSSRGTSRDGELIEYIKEKLIPYGNNEIVYNVFEKITSKTASTWDLLQLADICATTMFYTYEENGWGIRIPCYSKVLIKHLYRRNHRCFGYGIKYFANEMIPDTSELQSKWPCIPG